MDKPVLVVNGDNDTMLPTISSFHLAQLLPDAQLSIYPDPGHGGIFQHHDLFVAQALEFLAVEDHDTEHVQGCHRDRDVHLDRASQRVVLEFSEVGRHVPGLDRFVGDAAEFAKRQAPALRSSRLSSSWLRLVNTGSWSGWPRSTCSRR